MLSVVGFLIGGLTAAQFWRCRGDYRAVGTGCGGADCVWNSGRSLEENPLSGALIFLPLRVRVAIVRPTEDRTAVALVAAREMLVLETKPRVWSRIGALPYRFNFGNAGWTPLLDTQRCPEVSPCRKDLLLEDAWLTVAVGKQYVRKAAPAQVFFVFPGRGVIILLSGSAAEGGKIQLRRQHAHLLENGPISAYPWVEFLRNIRTHEYGLTLFACVSVAWRGCGPGDASSRSDFYTLYRPFTSTKRWAVAAPSSPQSSPQASPRPSGQSWTQQ